MKLFATIRGKVQGVSFRYYTMLKAKELGIDGFVGNQDDGSVYIEASGHEVQLRKLVDWCRSGSPASKVVEMKMKYYEFPIGNTTAQFYIKR